MRLLLTSRQCVSRMASYRCTSAAFVAPGMQPGSAYSTLAPWKAPSGSGGTFTGHEKRIYLALFPNCQHVRQSVRALGVGSPSSKTDKAERVHLDLDDVKDDDHEDLTKQLDMIAKLLDTTYKVPGTPFKLGLGTSLGRIPVAGGLCKHSNANDHTDSSKL